MRPRRSQASRAFTACCNVSAQTANTTSSRFGLARSGFRTIPGPAFVFPVTCGNVPNFIPRISRDQRPTVTSGGARLHTSDRPTARQDPASAQVSERFHSMSGGRGIRTHGVGHPTQRFSSPIRTDPSGSGQFQLDTFPQLGQLEPFRLVPTPVSQFHAACVHSASISTGPGSSRTRPTRGRRRTASTGPGSSRACLASSPRARPIP
jgi:hypothetical protein